MRPTSEIDVYATAGFGQNILRGASPAIVVVDFVYGFTDPAYPTGADMSDAVEATRKLLDAARGKGVPILFTVIAYSEGEISSLPWLRKASGMAALLRGSRLVEVDERLARRQDEPVLVKHGASAFHGTNLGALLTGLRTDTVIVVGATTSGCVRASVVDAVQYGFDVLVPRDCVADRATSPHEANLFDIQQKYGDVTTLGGALGYVSELVDRAV